MSTMITTTMSSEDTKVLLLLSRQLYLEYCRTKNFKPYDAPYVPAWCIDYAKVAIDYLGYDDEAVASLTAAAHG